MCMSGRQTPLRNLFKLRKRVVSLTGTTLEGKSSSILRPITAPEKHIVIFEVIGRRLLLNRHSLDAGLIPDQRPVIFGVDLVETLQPLSDTLRRAITKTVGQSVKQVVVCVK